MEMNSQPTLPEAISRESATVCVRGCKHCGLPVPSNSTGAEFCCRGCEGVYRFLHEHGLEGFYDRRVQEGALSGSPVALSSHRYSYLDDPKIDEDFIEKEGALCTATFRLRGLHCGACVWLIERLPGLVPGVMSAQVRFADGVALVRYPAGAAKLSEIASAFEHLGYTPDITKQSDVHGIATASPATLARLGVAAVSAMNAMMLAVSVYQGWFSGIEAKYEIFLSWMSLFVSLPSLLYSGLPFYRRAIASVRSGALHIDVPISIAIVVGSIVSVVHTVQGTGHIYYDSITILIFLLLAARFVQERTLQHRVKGLEQSGALPLYARRIEEGSIKAVFSGNIKPGDEVYVEPGDIIPVDGEVISGASSVDAAILSGESRPIPVEVGSPLFAGTKNLTEPLHFVARSNQAASRFGTLLRQIEDAGSRSVLIDATSSLAGYFVAAVLVTTLVAFLIWWSIADLARATDIALSVLVVTCPCALGLAAPLTITFAGRRAAGLGILLRGQDALERIAAVDRVALDKTGTVTNGMGTVTTFWVNQPTWRISSVQEPIEWMRRVRLAEEGTRHPSGQAILRFLETVPSAFHDLIATEEFSGRGVAATFHDGEEIRIGSAPWMRSLGFDLPDELLSPLATVVFVSSPNALLGAFVIEDDVRPGMSEFVRELQTQHLKVTMLSGDRSEVAAHVASEVGISPSEVFAEQSPEAKESMILDWSKAGKPAMVGDGVNDALALRASYVGIGISGGAEITLRVADCYVLEPSARTLSQVFSGSRRAVKAIKRNIAFSIGYNLLGGLLAVLGWINPLIAAVLMPVSSLTVVFVATSSRTFER